MNTLAPVVLNGIVLTLPHRFPRGTPFLPLPPDFSGEHYQQSDFARSRPEKTAVIF
jgi:hypothetical protein